MAHPVQRPGELIQGINVTPLVDVVLVLLIVLMLSASYSVSRSLPMQLPKAATGDPMATTPLSISVDRAGALYLNGKALSKAELRSAVRQSHAPGDQSALIAADGAVEHRAVVGVIDLLRAEGVTRFAINVAPEELKR
jgi:biopolymer transport protein ExbD